MLNFLEQKTSIQGASILIILSRESIFMLNKLNSIWKMFRLI